MMMLLLLLMMMMMMIQMIRKLLRAVTSESKALETKYFISSATVERDCSLEKNITENINIKYRYKSI